MICGKSEYTSTLLEEALSNFDGYRSICSEDTNLKVHQCRYKNLPTHSSSCKKQYHADCAL